MILFGDRPVTMSAPNPVSSVLRSVFTRLCRIGVLSRQYRSGQTTADLKVEHLNEISSIIRVTSCLLLHAVPLEDTIFRPVRSVCVSLIFDGIVISWE